MIPKRIFYVWGASEPLKRDVQVCLQTWRQLMPDFEIIQINENSKRYFNFAEELKHNEWFRVVYEKKLWAYVADYIRIKVLYDWGGIYFDTDVSVVKSLEPLLAEPAFVGIQSSGTYNYTEPAILGAQRGNKFLKKILDFYSERIWSEPIYTMPEIFADVLKGSDYLVKNFPEKEKQEIIHLSDITIYPEKYFIPFRFGEVFSPHCIERETYTIHWFSGSWCKPEVDFFLKNKHLNKNPVYREIRTHYIFGIIPIRLERQNSGMEISVGKRIFLFSKMTTSNVTTIKLFGLTVLTINSKKYVNL